MGIVGKVAVVTGVTSGVGQGIVREFVSRGVKVVGTGRRAEAGQAFEREIRANDGDFVFCEADVTVVDDCERTMALAVETYGRIDILINNAGTVGSPAIVNSHEASEEWWDSIVDTNLKGSFFCSQAALRRMVEQASGQIWNISSVNGVARGPARMAAYTAAKTGLIGMTQTMAVEYASSGVRINVVVLGTIEGETGAAVARDMASFVRGNDENPPDSRRPFKGEHLGATLALLCDDDAHLNGAVIPVDGAVSAGLLDSKMYYRLAAATPKG